VVPSAAVAAVIVHASVGRCILASQASRLFVCVFFPLRTKAISDFLSECDDGGKREKGDRETGRPLAVIGHIKKVTGGRLVASIHLSAEHNGAVDRTIWTMNACTVVIAFSCSVLLPKRSAAHMTGTKWIEGKCRCRDYCLIRAEKRCKTCREGRTNICRALLEPPNTSANQCCARGAVRPMQTPTGGFSLAARRYLCILPPGIEQGPTNFQR
jgi:hypothetical protein